MGPLDKSEALAHGVLFVLDNRYTIQLLLHVDHRLLPPIAVLDFRQVGLLEASPSVVIFTAYTRVVVIYGRAFHSSHALLVRLPDVRFKTGLGSPQELEFGVTVNEGSLGVRELARPALVDRSAYSAGRSHHFELRV